MFALVACEKPGPELEGTAAIVAEASKMSLAELEAAAKAEMEASNDTFKVVGLTSVLKKAGDAFKAKYEWIGDKMDVNNSYKDYALLQALETAEKSYFADFALVQDVRSIAAFDGDLLHNFVPSDYKELGLSEADTKPLKGIYFNKLFYTNTNFTNVTGKTLHNIWQLAGTEADADHLGLVSFQPATTEQINMSFLLSCEAPENQARIAEAYKSYYGKDWSSDVYVSAGQQWVTEFIANISRWHSSDGTAMKETQLKNDWKAGYVYYGAFAKMKDAVGKSYVIEGAAEDPILKDLMDAEGKVNAMDTVKWDWEIEGFNGFMYAMCSQIVNNAKHPYTACLYARFLVTLDAYEASVYNKDLPKPEGASKVNQYGYYAPASNNITYAVGDWTRDTHIQREIVENYEYLKTVRITQVNRILGLIASNDKAE
jgi:iron(III) transport system substrate-binding protein